MAYIQNWWRGAAAVASYREELHAVVVIQAGVRCAIASARNRYLRGDGHPDHGQHLCHGVVYTFDTAISARVVGASREFVYT